MVKSTNFWTSKKRWYILLLYKKYAIEKASLHTLYRHNFNYSIRVLFSPQCLSHFDLLGPCDISLAWEIIVSFAQQNYINVVVCVSVVCVSPFISIKKSSCSRVEQLSSCKT